MNKQKKYLVMPIARVVVTFNKKVLLVRRSVTDTTRPGIWEIPGGGVDAGENYEIAARREIMEEAGLELGQLNFKKTIYYFSKDIHKIAIIFHSEALNNEVKLSHEHDDFKWVDSSNIDNMNIDDHHLQYVQEYSETDDVVIDYSKNDEKSTTETPNVGKVVVHTDGGSRGNPGPSATGYVIEDEDGKLLTSGGDYLGITTNNQAEYQAVRKALELSIELGAKVVDFYIDSMLIVKQMNGEYKIKNRDLWPIHQNIKEMIKTLESVTFTHVRREYNKAADAKVNEVLDSVE